MLKRALTWLALEAITLNVTKAYLDISTDVSNLF